MRRLVTLAIAGLAPLSACGGGGAAGGAEPDGSVPETSDAGLGSGGFDASAAGPDATDASAVPFGEEAARGDSVEFVTTSSTTTTSTTTTTTTTLPPTTTTSTSTTSTTTTTTSTTTTSAPTSTTTTVPPPTTIRCSFAADAVFEPGEAELTADALAGFGDLAAVVSGIADVRSVRVEGHTDHRGSDEDNLTLSQARADAAAAALVDAGIAETAIDAVGLGESEAHQGTPTDEEMAGDRRVDIVVEADVPITTSC